MLNITCVILRLYIIYNIMIILYLKCICFPSCRSQNICFLPKWYCFKYHSIAIQDIVCSSFFSNINFNYFDNMKCNINDIYYHTRFYNIFTCLNCALWCTQLWFSLGKILIESLQLPDPDTAYQNCNHVTSNFLKKETKIGKKN